MEWSKLVGLTMNSDVLTLSVYQLSNVTMKRKKMQKMQLNSTFQLLTTTKQQQQNMQFCTMRIIEKNEPDTYLHTKICYS